MRFISLTSQRANRLSAVFPLFILPRNAALVKPSFFAQKLTNRRGYGKITSVLRTRKDSYTRYAVGSPTSEGTFRPRKGGGADGHVDGSPVVTFFDR